VNACETRQTEPNEHGIFENPEKIKVHAGIGFRVQIYIAEHQGLWRYGIDYYCGGLSTGMQVSSYLPSIKRTGYPTRDVCISTAEDALEQLVRKHINESDGWHPYVASMAKRILSSMLARKQLTLNLGGKK